MEKQQTIKQLQEALRETERAWRKERQLKKSWRAIALNGGNHVAANRE